MKKYQRKHIFNKKLILAFIILIDLQTPYKYEIKTNDKQHNFGVI